MNFSERSQPCDPLCEALRADGWLTPDTYCTNFAEAPNCPAVYLFVLVDQESYSLGIVAYVGMSRLLARRWAAHNILPMLHIPGYWPMRWFKLVEPHLLRVTEAEYITRFDPPWNIVGRTRGISLHG